MRHTLIYPAGVSAACSYAIDVLRDHNIPMIDHPAPEITHLLLDVPSFTDDGNLTGGQDPVFLLSMLSTSLTVIGGNLAQDCLTGYTKFDLLKSEDYLCRNAAITAHCAIKAALPYLRRTISDCNCTIVGWGRIGKCLSSLLRSIGCRVTLIIRNPKERSLANALGYHACSPEMVSAAAPSTHLLFNTAPSPVLSGDTLRHFLHCIKIDLASVPGLFGDDVIIERGLPVKLATESSGNLIADSILRSLKGGIK